MSKRKSEYSLEELKREFPKIKTVYTNYTKNSSLIHASNIIKKANDCISDKDSANKIKKLNILIPEYSKYLKAQQAIKMDLSFLSTEPDNGDKRSIIDSQIDEMVSLLNSYYAFFEEKKIEGKSAFDSRSKIRSTILEEFMYFLFRGFVDFLVADSKVHSGTIKNGNTEAYSNLYFTSSDIQRFIKAPSIEVNTKQQDYAIYREVEISIKNSSKEKRIANIPMLAIENKTFLDKTMLEGSIATAEKIKMGAPYSLYLVATETYAVKYEVDPVYSRIDQIFVLRKCKHNKENRLPQEIQSEVVKSMFWYVVSRLLRPWSAIEKRLAETGTII